jgi:hypothetical protein
VVPLLLAVNPTLMLPGLVYDLYCTRPLRFRPQVSHPSSVDRIVKRGEVLPTSFEGNDSCDGLRRRGLSVVLAASPAARVSTTPARRLTAPQMTMGRVKRSEGFCINQHRRSWSKTQSRPRAMGPRPAATPDGSRFRDSRRAAALAVARLRPL